ncbi:16S rRNA (uracil(1498)-N(3))-methyltransferase [Plantibacter sp. Mn2098]|uniref:16S rRNA (uracil(1498)-N(3))-methyltransferase n=1 Tax=Plantibacter sp. Mn2098 TaxID=3395266 RepID=UPI003BD69054
MSSLYFREDLESTGVGETISLRGPEAKHAVSVSRLRVGESTSIGNGRGLIASGPVTKSEPGELEIRVDSVVVHPEPRPAMVLVQALAKGDRDELAIQAATELGVDRIVPWSAERSISRWQGDKASKGRLRWQTIVREASKQSIRARVPEVADVVDTKQLTSLVEGRLVLVLEPTAANALSETVIDDGTTEILLVVGPEGGISPNERDRLAEAGAVAVRLGSGVLRTSTAGPAAISALSVLLRRW